MLSARTGKRMQLHGGGKSVRSFIHIKDVVKATLELAKEGEPGSTWHLSTNENYSIRELVERICKLTGANISDLVESTEERLGKDKHYLLDSTAIREIHGWSDRIKLEQGLKETLTWIDKNLATLRELPWTYTHKQ